MNIATNLKSLEVSIDILSGTSVVIVIFGEPEAEKILCLSTEYDSQEHIGMQHKAQNEEDYAEYLINKYKEHIRDYIGRDITPTAVESLI